ncbi:similar to signal peptide [Plenodomus lingam JN3]|uniref:Similar to signal peptide n=1 Tax=Leptosphaeria maculans (strain JN3 / isolate v23.1.3 / race Av1-4-5-6-7-8) TaxID=985895 RepID=E4ZJ64_LEPMJ|nr:similar to signal peptide [Plenodomus lingam JN3]CBX91495.1 similar to signal peptide [Plenodomus lingam JN3]
MAAEKLGTYAHKPRVFILSDISNEVDDAQSLVRYLLYANQFETKGLVACTSASMKNEVHPEVMEKIIDAYANAVDNLNKHTHPDHLYPSADHLRSLIRSGAESYGMTAVGTDITLSPGAQLLYSCITTPSTQPLWILCWGGTNTLASALLKIDDDFDPDDSKRLLSRLRVYSISDKDDTGAWIRNSFPDIFYIASIHGWNQYGLAAWTGISGEKHYGFDVGGPDGSKWEKDWLKENIQVGPLGTMYPDPMHVAEGDTPSLLHLIQNGLSIPDHPEYGSWGGRYVRTDLSTEGLNSSHYSDAADRVVVQGRTYTSNHATIWRWRDAFQNDFAARMRWTTEAEFANANHHPVITVNDLCGLAPVRIEAEAGSTITLDTKGTYHPNGSAMTFKWWHYREPSATQWSVEAEVAEVGITAVDKGCEGKKVQVKLPPAEHCAVELQSKKPVAQGQLLHLILEVTGEGELNLTSYRRVLIQVTNKDLRGGGMVKGECEVVMKDG